MAKTETRVKVVFTKAGEAYSATQAYRLHDYIVLDGVTIYACKKVDPATMTCVGHPLTDTAYWDKFMDIADFKAAAEKATASANAAAKSATDAAGAANTAKTNADKATEAANTAASAANTAKTNADTATTAANAAAAGAEKVNATITADNVLKVTDRTGAETSLSLAENAATVKKLTELEETDATHAARLSSLEQAVGDMGGTVDSYYIGSQDTTKASPDIIEASTNTGKQMLQDMYRPFLINHDEAKEGVEVMPADELKRNNWLRFADNSFAPAVGITEEMKAECDVELYLDAEHTQKYCDAGAFDAERFYNQYGMTQKLYNAEGNAVRILRPWETTSKQYSIKVGDPSVNYLLDDYPASEPDTLYRGILKSYREYKGMKPRKLDPTLISPCCDTSIKDTDGKVKFRSFFYLYNPGDTNTRGSVGDNGGTMFMEQGAYPRVNDVNQVSSMDYARNNNFDKTKTYPFAEIGHHAYNTFVCAHELLYDTNYINDPDNLFSSGTSSNDNCGNEAAWQKYGGVRIKMGDGEWKYLNWNATPNWIYKDANGNPIGTHLSAWINREYPKWRENEAQMALSFAAETGVAENTEFDFYGKAYWYVTPPKAKGVVDGYMNARVYCKKTDTWQGFDANGIPQTYTIEAILRQGVMDGVSTAGDIFHYRGGGMEFVSETLVTQDVSQVDYPTDIYIETDPKKWHSERAETKPNKGRFGFEDSYELVAHHEKTNQGYVMKRYGYTQFGQLLGGGRNTFVTSYNEQNNYFSNTIGNRMRRSLRFGGYASWWVTCAARSFNASTGASFASRSFGGSAQCLFSKRSTAASGRKTVQPSA